MPIDLSKKERSKNKTKDKVVLRAIQPPKNLETEMRKFNRFLVSQLRKRFENQVLKKMNVFKILSHY